MDDMENKLQQKEVHKNNQYKEIDYKKMRNNFLTAKEEL